MRLRHERRGSGPPLLLIHGIGGDWRSWEPLMDRLAAEREVIAVDVPGFGGSPLLPPGRRPLPDAFAEAVADLLRDEVGPGPVEVAGHSMGGWVALELAKLGMASRVIAIAPAGFWTPREAAFSRASLRLTVWATRNARPLLDWGFRRPLVRAALLAGQFGHPTRVTEEQVRGMNDTLWRSTGFDDTLAAMTRERFRDGPATRVPVTIVWGTRDTLLLPRQAPRAAREIPGAELVWIEGAGHFAHWDDQDATIRVLLGR